MMRFIPILVLIAGCTINNYPNPRPTTPPSSPPPQSAPAPNPNHNAETMEHWTYVPQRVSEDNCNFRKEFFEEIAFNDYMISDVPVSANQAYENEVRLAGQMTATENHCTVRMGLVARKDLTASLHMVVTCLDHEGECRYTTTGRWHGR
jgi:hypothetical protein